MTSPPKKRKTIQQTDKPPRDATPVANAIKVLFPSVSAFRLALSHQLRQCQEEAHVEIGCQTTLDAAPLPASLLCGPKIQPQLARSLSVPITTIDGMRIFSLEVEPSIEQRYHEVRELVEPALIDYLCRKRIAFRPLGMQLMMLGVEEARAKPWIVVICSEKARGKVKVFMKKDFIRGICQGPDTCQVRFDTAVVGRALTPSDGEEHHEVFMEQGDRESLEPSPSQIKVVQSGTAHYAMIGGYVTVINLQGKRSVYGLTAGHILPADLLYDRDVETLSDVENNDSDDDSSGSESSGVLSTTRSHCGDEELLNSAGDVSDYSGDVDDNRNWTCIGRISKASYSTQARNRDWALVELTDSIDEPISAFNALPHTEFEVAYSICGHGAVMAKGSMTTCVMSRLPARAVLPSGRSFVDVHVLQLPTHSRV